MDWIVCAHCGGDLDATATTCLHCGADPRTGEGAWSQGLARRAPRQWRRVPICLAISLAAALGAVLLLRVVGHTLPASSHIDWFRTGCAILGLIALVAAIGAATWTETNVFRRRVGRDRGTHPLLAMCLGAFGIVLFGVGLSDIFSSPNLATSANWAGYVTATGGITRVSATWTQPHVHSRGVGLNQVAFWVGLDSEESHTVEQIGTQGYAESDTMASYDAWFEMYPEPKRALSGWNSSAVRAGDTVTATVARLGHDRFRLTLVNDTTGARFATTQDASGVGDTDGAIVVEAQVSGSTLAGFDPVRFSECAFNRQSIDAFTLTAVDMITRGGVAEATTSKLGAGGASFTVTRR